MWRANVVGAVVLGACGFEIGAIDDFRDGPPNDARTDAIADAPVDAPGPPIQRVQSTAFFENSGSSVSLAFPMPQTAGNTNIVVVSWSSGAGDVAGVTDTAGNTYVRAPLQIAGQFSMRLFYAQTIAASPSNRVTATFPQSVPFPKLRILEYQGLATTTLYEAGMTAAGTGTTQMAGPITTTTPHVLLFACNVYNGSSHPIQPFEGVDYSDGDLIETYEVHAPGTFTATANGISNTNWVMMLVAFRGR